MGVAMIGSVERLASASAQAAVLAIAVWLLCRLLRATPAWRHALWCVVLIRFALPVAPPASWSLYNWLPTPSGQFFAAQTPPTRHSAPPSVVIDDAPLRKPQAESRAGRGSPTARPRGLRTEVAERPVAPAVESEIPDGSTSASPTATVGASGRRPIWRTVASWVTFAGGIIWLIGAAFFTARWARGVWRLHRWLGSLRGIVRGEPRVLLAQCMRRLGMKRGVRLLLSTDDGSPAAAGVLRPAIVIPEQLLAELSNEQLRYVLLHELAHIRRWDALVNTAALLIRSLHWFNPLVWVTVRQLQVTRELACDAMSLQCVPAAEHRAYGRTALQVLEALRDGSPTTALALGAADGGDVMEQRVKAIRDFRAPSIVNRLLGAACCAAIALVGLTGSSPARSVDNTLAAADADIDSIRLAERPAAPQPEIAPLETEAFAIDDVDLQTREVTLRRHHTPIYIKAPVALDARFELAAEAIDWPESEWELRSATIEQLASAVERWFTAHRVGMPVKIELAADRRTIARVELSRWPRILGDMRMTQTIRSAADSYTWIPASRIGSDQQPIDRLRAVAGVEVRIDGKPARLADLQDGMEVRCVGSADPQMAHRWRPGLRGMGHFSWVRRIDARTPMMTGRLINADTDRRTVNLELENTAYETGDLPLSATVGMYIAGKPAPLSSFSAGRPVRWSLDNSITEQLRWRLASRGGVQCRSVGRQIGSRTPATVLRRSGPRASPRNRQSQYDARAVRPRVVA
ncbi:MAG: M56 family metallopeptidase [Pirellulaceae bacterium]|nr:M56 family metallopeptidase [Pirellulaceae bacterium]